MIYLKRNRCIVYKKRDMEGEGERKNSLLEMESLNVWSFLFLIFGSVCVRDEGVRGAQNGSKEE